ncbi:hypothetical protein M514_12355, partial [Trichuris suis]
CRTRAHQCGGERAAILLMICTKGSSHGRSLRRHMNSRNPVPARTRTSPLHPRLEHLHLGWWPFGLHRMVICAVQKHILTSSMTPLTWRTD